MSVFTLSGDTRIVVESNAEFVREGDVFHVRARPSAPEGTPIMGDVAIVNQSTNVKDPQILKLMSAVKKQADQHISQYWSYSVDFTFVTKGAPIPTSDWYCLFTDTSDTAGAAGWHDVGPNNEPIIKCFTVDAGDWNVTFSHEIAESISDTNANTTVQGLDEQGNACLYFQESCDPVENNTYTIDGVTVSDFVTPQWFTANSKGPYDYMAVCTAPFEILPGGYMQVSYDKGQTWNEVDKNSKRSRLHRARTSRYELYKTPIDERIRSTFRTL